MKLEGWQTVDDRRRWKIVRRDNCSDVHGDVISADEETGEACLLVTANGKSETKTFSFGPAGIRIVGRRR
jgi:hypothetical protein